MSYVTLQGYILVPEQDLAAVTQALADHTALTLAEPGCLHFTVTPSADNPLRFDVYETFIDQAAFAQHQARVHASDWGMITRNVSRHYHISA